MKRANKKQSFPQLSTEQKVDRSMVLGKQLPNFPQQEKILLHNILTSQSVQMARYIFQDLRYYHFYSPANQKIAKFLFSLAQAGKSTDFMDIAASQSFSKFDADLQVEFMQITSMSFPMQVSNSQKLIDEAVKAVYDSYLTRKTAEVMSEMIYKAVDPLLTSSDLVAEGMHKLANIKKLAEHKDRIEIDEYRYRRSEPPKSNKPSILFNGRGIGFSDSICAITGGAGSRKSTLLQAIAAAAVHGGEYLGFSFSRKMKVNWYDTEQPETRFYKFNKRLEDWVISVNKDQPMEDILENSYLNYKPYKLRKFSATDRLKFVKQSIAEDKPDVAIIDGLVDLCEDYNSNLESKKLLDEIMVLAETYKCMLFCVLHRNRSALDKMRGHLGTELENKADLVIQVELDAEDESQSIVRNTKSREPKFKSFEISQDANGFPYLVNEVFVPQF